MCMPEQVCKNPARKSRFYLTNGGQCRVVPNLSTFANMPCQPFHVTPSFAALRLPRHLARCEQRACVRGLYGGWR
jgi:hypothetical protein